MTTDGTILVDHLSKTFGPVRAVDDLSFEVEPGRVTGFLGPERRRQDDDAAHAARPGRARRGGTATIGGRPLRATCRPRARSAPRSRRPASTPAAAARDHLRVLAPPPGSPDAPGRRGARAGRADRGRATGGSAATRSACGSGSPWPPRCWATRGSSARRAGQRPRPRGHPLAARLPARPRRRGPDRAGLQPRAGRGRSRPSTTS